MERWKEYGLSEETITETAHLEVRLSTIDCLNEMVAMNASGNSALGQPSAHELQSDCREFHSGLGSLGLGLTEPSYSLLELDSFIRIRYCKFTEQKHLALRPFLG